MYTKPLDQVDVQNLLIMFRVPEDDAVRTVVSAMNHGHARWSGIKIDRNSDGTFIVTI